MQKNIILKTIIVIILLTVVGGGGFLSYKWYKARELKKENEKMLSYLDSEFLKDDYYSALEAEEKIKAGSDILLPYVQAAFYWKSLGDSSGNEIFYDRAISIYKDAIDKFGMQYYMPYANLAGIYQTMGKFKKAEEMLKTAIEVAPGEESLYIRLADLYRYDLGKPKEDVLAVYDEGLSRVLSTLSLVLNKATYLRDIEEKEEALSLFELIYESHPESIYKFEIDSLRKELGMAPLQ